MKINDIPLPIKQMIVFTYKNSEKKLDEICTDNGIPSHLGSKIIKEYEDGLIEEFRELPKQPIHIQNFEVPNIVSSKAANRFNEAEDFIDDEGHVRRNVRSNPKFWEENG